MAENEEALASLVADKLRRVTAVKAPSSGHNWKAVLQDLTAIMGAEMMSQGTVKNWRDLTAKTLGTAESAKIDGFDSKVSPLAQLRVEKLKGFDGKNL